MKRKNTWTIVAAACLAAGATGAHAAFTAVGVYDEQTFQANAVDAVAAANAGDEMKVVESSEYNDYKVTVATAFANGLGGVVNFDENRWSEIADGVAFDASFDGGNKSLPITPSITGLVLQGNASAHVPISGGAGPADQPVGLPGGILLGGSTATSASFAIGALTGGDPLEIVDSIGLTMLSRASRDYGTVTAMVTFSDSTTASASHAIGAPGAGNGDTFFGFVAPLGLSITDLSLTWSTTSGLPGFDDLAFTTTVVPEPTSAAALLGLGGLTMLARRRRP